MRERLLLPSLVLVATVTAVVSSLGAPLIPMIAAEYDVTLHTAQWALTGTLIAGAVVTPVLGRLGDGRSRRPVLLTTLTLVTLATALSALPVGFEAFLAGRIVQGAGLAMAPLAIAAARDAIPGDRLASPLAILSVAVVAGAGLGHPLSGLTAQHWGLHGAFWLGAALCAATLVLTAAVVPPAATEKDGRIDWIGAPLLAAGTTAVLLATSQGTEWGWLSPTVLGLVGLGIVLLGTWVRWTLASPHPLVDLRLARRPGLLGVNFTALTAGLGMYLMLTLVVVVVQEPGWGLGSGAAMAGLMLVPYSVASVLGSRIPLVVARRRDPRVVLALGCSLYVVAALTMAWAHTEVWHLVLAMAIGGLGSGCSFSALPGLVVRAVPAHETGSAMAFTQVLRYLGFSVGTTVGVTVLGLFDQGRPTERGLVAALLVAALVMLVAVIVNAVLARGDSHSEATVTA